MKKKKKLFNDYGELINPNVDSGDSTFESRHENRQYTEDYDNERPEPSLRELRSRYEESRYERQRELRNLRRNYRNLRLESFTAGLKATLWLIFLFVIIIGSIIFMVYFIYLVFFSPHAETIRNILTAIGMIVMILFMLWFFREEF